VSNTQYLIFKYAVLTLVFVVCTAFSCFLFWLGGFDFDSRGRTATSCAALSALLGVMAVCFTLLLFINSDSKRGLL